MGDDVFIDWVNYKSKFLAMDVALADVTSGQRCANRLDER